MYRITVFKPFAAKEAFIDVGEYIVLNQAAGSILSNRVCEIEEKLKTDIPKYPCESVLFVRPGAFGDLLFMTPALRHLRKKYPAMRIGTAQMGNYRVVLENTGLVDEIISYPIKLEDWDRYKGGQIAALEGVIEGNDERKTVHAIELMSRFMGVDMADIEDKRMAYVVSDAERLWANTLSPRTATKRVGIQLSSSGPVRTYFRMQDVCELLLRRGHEVHIFGAPGQIKTKTEGKLINWTAQNLDFRQSCAMLTTCDALVAPDSGLCHIGGALDIPTVALYGPFDWKLRTNFAPSIRALTGTLPCAPCHHHSDVGEPNWPEDGPCNQTGKCEALQRIQPQRIVSEVEKMLR